MFYPTVCLVAILVQCGYGANPVITPTHPPKDVKFIQAGQTLDLMCRGPKILSWHHNDGSTSASDKQLYTNESIGLKLPLTSGHLGPTEEDLQIEWTNVPVSASGSLICKTSSDSSTTTKEISVVQVMSEDIFITNQTSLSIICDITGLENDKSRFQSIEWEKNRQPLDTTPTKYSVSGSYERGNLTIHNIDRTDAAAYACLVKVKFFGQVIPFTRKTQVYRKIEVDPFYGKSLSKNLIEGDKLSLACKVFGHEVSKIEWFLNDVGPLMTGRIEIKEEKLPNDTLYISELEESDRGDYMCVAIDTMNNKANATVLIRVKDKYAALWPFLGICAEVAVLCLIIFIYERRRSKQLEQDDKDSAVKEDLLNSHGEKSDDVRKRNK